MDIRCCPLLSIDGVRCRLWDPRPVDGHGVATLDGDLVGARAGELITRRAGVRLVCDRVLNCAGTVTIALQAYFVQAHCQHARPGLMAQQSSSSCTFVHRQIPKRTQSPACRYHGQQA